VTFTGRGRLFRRPLGVYAKIFSDAGVKFTQTGESATVEGFLNLTSRVCSLPGDVSSQFVSGLLFALPLLKDDSEIHLTTPLESRQYVDMTIDVMKRFGVEITEPDERVFFVRGGQRYRGTRYKVETDYSQAAFFLAASALGADVSVAGLASPSVQGDGIILGVLRDAGAEISWEGGAVRASASRLRAVRFDARNAPDLVPPVAALCCFCDGTSEITGAGRLRLKESDRLSALASELKKLGADISETEDSLSITGARSLRGGAADAWGDHRIAMAIAVAAIRCDEPATLTGWRSVEKSYPDFWRDFEGERR
jgi:3-phosphoshikimate 1-carboxyvinyltransferase